MKRKGKLRWSTPSIPALRRQRLVDLSLRPGWSTEQVQQQPRLGNEGEKKQKAGEDVIEQRGHVPAPSKQQNFAALAMWFFLALELRIKETGMGLERWLRG